MINKMIPSKKFIESLYTYMLNTPPIYESESALDSILDKLMYGIPSKEEKLTIFQDAAIIFHDIIVYHVFIDGCKRMAFALAMNFLQLNGYQFRPPKKDVFHVDQNTKQDAGIPIETAMNQHDYEFLTNWFRQNSTPINYSMVSLQ